MYCMYKIQDFIASYFMSNVTSNVIRTYNRVHWISRQLKRPRASSPAPIRKPFTRTIGSSLYAAVCAFIHVSVYMSGMRKWSCLVSAANECGFLLFFQVVASISTINTYPVVFLTILWYWWPFVTLKKAQIRTIMYMPELALASMWGFFYSMFICDVFMKVFPWFSFGEVCGFHVLWSTPEEVQSMDGREDNILPSDYINVSIDQSFLHSIKQLWLSPSPGILAHCGQCCKSMNTTEDYGIIGFQWDFCTLIYLIKDEGIHQQQKCIISQYKYNK